MSRACLLRRACRASWKRIRIGSRVGWVAYNHGIPLKCAQIRIRLCWPRTSQRCCRAPLERFKTRLTAVKWSKKRVDYSSCHLGRRPLCSSRLTTCKCRQTTPCMKNWTQIGSLQRLSMKIASRVKGEHRLGHHWLRPLAVPPSPRIMPPCNTCRARCCKARNNLSYNTYLKSRVVCLTPVVWQPLLRQTNFYLKYQRRPLIASLRKITR